MRRPIPAGRTASGYPAERKEMNAEIERRAEMRGGREFTVRVFESGHCEGAGSFSPDLPVRSRRTTPTRNTTD